MHCTNCTAHCPQAVRECAVGVAVPTTHRQCGISLQELHCPPPQGSQVVHCTSSTAHCPWVVWQRMTRVPLPVAHRQRATVLHDSQCPQPPGSEAVRCKNSTAHCPRALRQCIAGVPLPTAPRQCASALQELPSLGSDHLLSRTPRPPSWWAHALHEFHCPPPPGNVAVHCRSCTTYCTQALRQCVVGVALPTAPK